MGMNMARWVRSILVVGVLVAGGLATGGPASAAPFPWAQGGGDQCRRGHHFCGNGTDHCGYPHSPERDGGGVVGASQAHLVCRRR